MWTHGELLPKRSDSPPCSGPGSIPIARPMSPSSARQHPGLRVRPVRRRPGRGRPGRAQPHPARRAPARDISYTDVQLLITEPRHQDCCAPVADGLDLPGGILVSNRFADGDDPPVLGESLDEALGGLGRPTADRWTGRAGRAGRRRPVGPALHIGDLGRPQGGALHPAPAAHHRQPDDHGARRRPRRRRLRGHAPVPLQLVDGGSGPGPGGRGLGRPGPAFSASRFLDDVRRYGATWFNYTGKPLAYLLATPERPTTPTTPCASPSATKDRPRWWRPWPSVSASDRRRFGSTEGAIALDRSGGRRGFGRAPATGDHDRRRRGNEAPRAAFDDDGRLINAEECVGEIVNSSGSGRSRGTTATKRPWPDHPQRLVLERRPRLRRRRRLGLFRRPHLGLAEGGRRELPGGADRGHRGPPSRRDDGVGLRRPRLDSGDQVMVALVLRDGAAFDPGPSPPGSTPSPT